VSTTTLPPSLELLLHERIAAGLEPSLRPWRAGYQVRVRPFPNETRPTALEAIALRDELVARRDAGDRSTRPRSTYDPTLAAACATLLVEQQGRHRAGELTDAGLDHYRQATLVWREPAIVPRHGAPFAAGHDPADPRRRPFCEQRLSELDPAGVARYLHRHRRAQAATSARNERQVLDKVLALAAVDGAQFDAGLRAIEPVPGPRRDRTRVAYATDELDLLVACAPAYGARMLHLAATVGLRVNELWTLTEERVDLEAATVFVPAHLAKERRDKLVPLLPAEVRLLREQLLARAPGTRLVFPTKTGRPWPSYGQFHRLVYGPARQRARVRWIREQGLEHVDAGELVSPFDSGDLRKLRRTAATLMREAGLEPELVAARLGHADGGALLLSTYRADVDRETLAARLAELGDSLEAAAARRAPRPATTPAAAVTAGCPPAGPTGSSSSGETPTGTPAGSILKLDGRAR
jgi:integrase